MSARAQSSRPEDPLSSSRSNIPNTSRTARSDVPIDSARSSTLNTARAETVLAALAAERTALENRLSVIEAALAQEEKKSFQKPRAPPKNRLSAHK